ncbi:hypothetical protein [Aeromonas sp. sif2433]|uniref:hypothetical protein n=1 Tax=Aeromonas sp. sif2433 TaxID=2854794 RepID=UPI001C438EF1|nr:hypothetical protein [Aeromonas sp. sif2433]MBV7414958.1 hypothetical protein [Aeromonas sp. sif2433]
MKKIILLMSVAGLMAGCSSPAQRMADCQAQGISKDTCYLAEQNRQTVILGAAEKQAMENASKAVK